jgi:hypothetical protein
VVIEGADVHKRSHTSAASMVKSELGQRRMSWILLDRFAAAGGAAVAPGPARRRAVARPRHSRVARTRVRSA